MSWPELVVYRDADLLVMGAAARLATRLADLQSADGRASVALTGGRTGTAVLAQLRDAPERATVDWSRVDLYWSDERFLPSGHQDRNETQARHALVDDLSIPPTRVHPMGSSDGPFGDDPVAAADAYAELLAAQPGPADHARPLLDICLLGVGADGHVASVFPAAPAVVETERIVVAVRDSPKPPPMRISLTLPAIRRCTEVWLMTSGQDKAAAVAMALSGADETQVPAVGARGLRHTLWLLDEAAAAGVPARFWSPPA